MADSVIVITPKEMAKLLHITKGLLAIGEICENIQLCIRRIDYHADMLKMCEDNSTRSDYHCGQIESESDKLKYWREALNNYIGLFIGDNE